MNNVVYLENIDKRFGGVHALKNLTLHIEEGKVHCLAGENGCGKSTLIKTISGVHTPDMGKIFLNGEEHHKLTPMQSISAGIQVIYQDFSLFQNLSVAENIAMNKLVKNRRKFISEKDYKEIAREALDKIGVDLDLSELVENLSVADKQLVAIARALTSEKSHLIIMDEPTSALTHTEIQRLLDIIRLLKKQNIAILFVSHKLKELMEVCDQFIVMRNGQIVEEGPVENFDEKKISALMIGREIESSRKEKKEDSEEVILEVDGISYKDKFKDISFSLGKGEILGITGLLGCGRTEIVSSLFGVLPVDHGEIRVKGNPVKISNPSIAKKNGIGYVPEDRLTEGLLLQQSIQSNGIMASLENFSSRFGIINFDRVRSIVSEKIRELKLNTSDISVPVRTLSGGNQQRVVIAKWLCADIDILILNGPSVGVDVGSKFEIHKKIQELRKAGTSVIIVSDDIPELVDNCDRVLLIHKGELHKEYGYDSITEEVLMAGLDEIR
ncbi:MULTISPECIES: sugar ABC transporter ATP-binding protein [unclassified Oceanispirochaeta]|uniref:sugar ABC transporter ATP-binding protein n=1 Tax=unclassified Oceanispirochaeta TaxID=2635722 RepID=UPI000E092E25|nr:MULTISPECIES: sugar ABC transporter ATP-binding protein [unclassified Oceanispirochaeta]MBF9015821.1 sugar ABC transporter ATP-binding protein [Oceanispirochaeta sp. M2]NPD72284.1 sugar ABC transporter ATP-binding protein [Oceanispirochaeta sp. M1]RDG32377.1 sugar ABC transporter ATP-binding protein [Oceanispirochaeta sp. M1]